MTFKVGQVQDFPVSEAWVYKLHLLGRTSLTITATSSGTEYTFLATAAQTATLTPGTYQWTIRASKGAESYTLDNGPIEVLEDANVADTTDKRSFDQKMLDAIRILLYGNGVLSDAEQYQIHGRMLVKMSRLDLEKWRNIYEAKVALARGGGRLPPIEIGFKRA